MSTPDQSQLASTPPPTSDRRTRPRIDPAKAAHYDAIYTLARASEAHDEDTGAHVLRIRRIVECLAIELGHDEETARDLGHDAMLHDVGKLRIPPSVLKKPGELTPDERQVMESHTVRGERLLSDRPTMQRASRIARSHHECWDGSGYPDGLAGEDIPQEARITAVADVMDALISERCYKQSWEYGDALKEVVSMGGSKLDPRVIEALQRADADGSLRQVFGLA